MPIWFHLNLLVLLLTLAACRGGQNASLPSPTLPTATTVSTVPPPTSPAATTATAIPSPATAPAPTATPLPTDEFLLGFHIDRGNDAHLGAARAAGGKFAVVVFSWADIEPVPNYWYWEVPDAALRAADHHNLRIVARLDRPPAWALSNDDPTPWRLDAYTNFVRRVLNRYGDRLDGVIIWNEPNLALEWHNQSPDPAAYAAMLATVYPVAKEVAPEVPVFGAALAFTLDDSPQAMNDLRYLQAMLNADAGQYIDGLALHPYGFGQPPDAPASPGELNFRRLELHHRLLNNFNLGHKRFWITEMGWRTAAPNPNDRWQVVSPTEQTTYTLAALDQIARDYPWIERAALWELNARGDDYGYYLWHGPDEIAPLYQTLVDRCTDQPLVCNHTVSQADARQTIDLLKPDVIIRLGDRGTVHPHWVHLYQGGENFSPRWEGEFFLSDAEADQNFDLLLETMQVDQGTNQLHLNDRFLGKLRPRTRPDPSSTWVTQHLTVSADLLQPGRNVLRLDSGQRNPAWQYDHWRWENLQIRNLRLVQTPALTATNNWVKYGQVGGWSEGNRLRPGRNGQAWLLGNRPGELWRWQDGQLSQQATNRSDLVFVDWLGVPDESGRPIQLTATDRGIFVRPASDTDWQTLPGLPSAYSYRLHQAIDGSLYAAFENEGLWQTAGLDQPWQTTNLPSPTVLDLTEDPGGQLYAATPNGVFQRAKNAETWIRLPDTPSGTPFVQRLYHSPQTGLIARSNDRLWRWQGDTGSWTNFGPADRSVLSVNTCCTDELWLGTRRDGVLRTDAQGSWSVPAEPAARLNPAVDLLALPNHLLLAGENAFMQSIDDGRTWTIIPGQSDTVSDLLVDPGEPGRWLAATPAGVYRSLDQGHTWTSISPPWPVWDMAFDSAGRLHVAFDGGLAWTDDSSGNVTWQQSRGLEGVLFFNLSPAPGDPQQLWAGTWGNNIAYSTDGGQSLQPLHNGLETLSMLSILRHPTPGQFTVGTIEGLFRSDDDGESWFKLPGPLQNQTVHDLLQGDDGTIWAAAADGLWASRDFGVTWTRTDGIPPITFMRLGQLDQTDGLSLLWAGTEETGLWLSRNGGRSWDFAGLTGRSIYQLLPHPTDPVRLLAATDDGLYASP